MTAVSGRLLSIGICAVGAILEGIAAGSNIKPLFAKLRFPSYSAPLWVWYMYLTYAYRWSRGLLRLNSHLR